MSTTNPLGNSSSNRERFILLLVSVALILAGFKLHGGVGFNIADEGFLWDGVRRTAAGDVPSRDFSAYDPGRYYWCAACSYFFGDGLIGLRLATSLFRVCGVFLGLLLVRRVTRNPAALLLFGLILLAWHPTYYKTFEATIATAAVYFGVLLIEKPSSSHYFLSGLAAGIAAVFGRNLGLYTVMAHGSIIGFLVLKGMGGTPVSRRLLWWSAGIVVGYSPILGMLALTPGFAESFYESIAFHFWLGQTNLTLPIPWPWTIDSSLPRLEYGVQFAVGLTFSLWLLAVSLGLIGLSRLRHERIPQRALLVSSTFSAAFFAHHAFSRADYEHLAHVIPPLLLVVLAGIACLWNRSSGAMSLRSVGLIAALSVMTALATLPYNFPTQYYGRLGPRWEYVEYPVAGETILIPIWQVEAIQMVEGALSRHLRPDERFVIGPYEAGFYSVFGQASPLWNSYLVCPEMESRQQRMIRELETKNVGVALINDVAAVDGNLTYRFRNSHPLVWRHLCSHFQTKQDDGLPPGWMVFSRE